MWSCMCIVCVCVEREGNVYTHIYRQHMEMWGPWCHSNLPEGSCWFTAQASSPLTIRLRTRPCFIQAAPRQWLSIAGMLVHIHSYRERDYSQVTLAQWLSIGLAKTLLELHCSLIHFLLSPFPCPSTVSDLRCNLKVLSDYCCCFAVYDTSLFF